MATETQEIMDKLSSIQLELNYIKEHMIDVDTILSEEERKLLDLSIKNEEEGKLTSFEELDNVRNKAR